jgi:hypothetical protein
VLKNDGPLLLPPSDPRSQRVARVASRLVTALEEQDHHIVCGATWPPRSQELGRVIAEREAMMVGGGDYHNIQYHPSGTARSSFMPWRPATSNPLKKLESADWNLYVIDLVSMDHPKAMIPVDTRLAPDQCLRATKQGRLRLHWPTQHPPG